MEPFFAPKRLVGALAGTRFIKGNGEKLVVKISGPVSGRGSGRDSGRVSGRGSGRGSGCVSGRAQDS